MKRIKKFGEFLNEYFDTEELKAVSEIEYLTGELDFEKIIDIEGFEINRILDMLGYKFPLFLKLMKQKQLLYFQDGKTSIYRFDVDKEGFQVSFLISKDSQTYTVSVGLKGPDFDPQDQDKLQYRALSVKNQPIRIESAKLQDLRDKVLIEKCEDLNVDFVYDIVERRFFKYLEFIGRKDLIAYNKSSEYNIKSN